MLTFLFNLRLGIWRKGNSWRFPGETVSIRRVHGRIEVNTTKGLFYTYDVRWYRCNP